MSKIGVFDVSVKDGEASISFPFKHVVYKGSTCAKGTFPPIGLEYERFSFAPVEGVSGLIVFERNHRFVGAPDLLFFHYYWEKERLYIKLEGDYEPKRKYLKIQDVGYAVQGGRRIIYIHQIPNTADNNFEYRMVDVIDLMRYVEGTMSLRQLSRASAKLEMAPREGVSAAEIEEKSDTKSLWEGTTHHLYWSLAPASAFTRRMNPLERLRRFVARWLIGRSEWEMIKNCEG